LVDEPLLVIFLFLGFQLLIFFQKIINIRLIEQHSKIVSWYNLRLTLSKLDVQILGRWFTGSSIHPGRANLKKWQLRNRSLKLLLRLLESGRVLLWLRAVANLSFNFDLLPLHRLLLPILTRRAVRELVTTPTGLILDIVNQILSLGNLVESLLLICLGNHLHHRSRTIRQSICWLMVVGGLC